MGADIHSRVEVRRERHTYPGEQWRGKRWLILEDEIFTNSWFDPDSDYAPFREQYTCVPLSNRNYTLFALLANVRNGRGFAGVVTGDPITPLAEPRGVPDDASHGWLAEVDSWDVDMHSHTWFTLQELLKDNPLYDQRLVRRGVITGLDYEKLKAGGGQPEEWSGSVSGHSIRTVTRDEYDAGERAPELDEEGRQAIAGWTNQVRAREYENPASRTYVEYVWEDSLREATRDLHRMIAELKRYADDLPPVGKTDHKGKAVGDATGWHGHGGIDYADIRVMVGFDN